MAVAPVSLASGEALDAMPLPWVAALLFCIDPPGTGAVVRAGPGPARDRWLELVRAQLPPDEPMRRVPCQVGDDRLVGGLDLGASLAAGRPVIERGLLASCHGGVVVLAMAERQPAGTAARLAAVLDHGVVRLERDGLSATHPARIGVVALDEGLDEDEGVAPALLDRLGLLPDLSGESQATLVAWQPDPERVLAARERLPRVELPVEAPEALCAAAARLGVDSSRALMACLRVARACAAAEGRDMALTRDLALAAGLVLAPRATRLPAPPEAVEAAPDTPPPAAPGDDPRPDAQDLPSDEERARNLEDMAVAAATAALPGHLLAALAAGVGARVRATPGGRAGDPAQGAQRGRPAGIRRGKPGRGARLHLLETLRAAVPWQPLRQRECPNPRGARLQVRRDDFRVVRLRQRTTTTTVFAVDASGSSALHRLAEAKGAVEILLSECYVRRDQVALIAFRGQGAEVVLPPTRSLVRARRGLAGLRGGGATPLAAAIDAARELSRAVRRRGGTPLTVFLTDGKANVARDGTQGREAAAADALAAAGLWRAEGGRALLVDTSPRPQPVARSLAAAMGARYLPLPHAQATGLGAAVGAALQGKDSGRAA